MDWRPISADSHITEPPNCYRDHIDPAFRERAPKVVSLEKLGDTFVVDGMKTPVPLGLIAAGLGIHPGEIVGRAIEYGDGQHLGQFERPDQESDDGGRGGGCPDFLGRGHGGERFDGADQGNDGEAGCQFGARPKSLCVSHEQRRPATGAFGAAEHVPEQHFHPQQQLEFFFDDQSFAGTPD